jgi:predicted nuclease of predicted toxin-antitoxin system
MFLANENFPFPSIALLRKQGYAVISICESYSGISDEKVLELAVEQQLIILTFDSDYGELIFKYKKDPPPAVIYFRNKGFSPIDVANILLDLLQSQSFEFYGKFSVIEQDAIRQRLLF